MGTNIYIIDNLDNLIERRYTMATEAQLRAIKKWSTEKVDEIKIRVPKGQKAEIQAFAKAHGETVNAFVNRLIHNAMTAEKNGTPRTK